MIMKIYLLDFTRQLENPQIEGLTAAFEATHNPMAAIATAYFAVPLEYKKSAFLRLFYTIFNYLLIINVAAPMMPALYPSVAETRSTAGEFVYP